MPPKPIPKSYRDHRNVSARPLQNPDALRTHSEAILKKSGGLSKTESINCLLLFDNKKLIYRAGCFKVSGMNATETVPKNMNLRLNRIQAVSRIIRLIILGILIFAVGYYLIGFLPFMTSWSSLAFTLPAQIVLWIWYWKLAKLFHFYEGGLIFAPQAIRCIKMLGYLCIINWVVIYGSQAWTRHVPPSHVPPPPAPHLEQLPHGVIVQVVKSTAIEPFFKMGFFSFTIGTINFGLLLAGIGIVIIAWIMDEGRKIQEEQELTV